MAPSLNIEMPRLGDGTNICEILLMGVISVSSVMMSNFVVELLQKHGFLTKKKVQIRFIAEFLSLMLPLLFMFTIFGDHGFWLLGILLCILFVTGTFCYHPKTNDDYYHDFRCYLHVSTVIAILGVDFPFFHRRFAKTRALGISPMDLGTAFYVLSMGYGSGLYKQLYQYSKKTIFSTIGLTVLGLLKAFFIHFSGISYHSEVTEYGVYWNFFISLAILKIAGPILFPGIFLFALAISQFFDNHLDSLMVEDRNLDNFFNSNREGIISLAAYVALFDLGRLFAIVYRKLQGQAPTTFKGFLIHLVYCPCTYIFYLITLEFGHAPCRRFANPAYVSICLFFFIVCLTMFSFVNGMSERVSEPPSLVGALSRSGFVIFITGNLLTGLVNLSTNTEKITNPVISTIIMLIYLFIIALAGYMLQPPTRAPKKAD